MAFQRYINGYDQCVPPVCPDDITVVIESWSCSNKILYVTWEIEDVYDRVLDVTSNILQWSCDSREFNNSIGGSGTSPYSANASVSSCTGLIYFKIKLVINNTTFESEERTIHIDDCQLIGDDMVRATLCTCDIPQINPGYNLYVNETGIPTRPVYFNYDDRCWYIDEEAWANRIPVGTATGTMINSVTEDHSDTYSNCPSCCLNLDCPGEEWIDVPGNPGLQVANFYLVYNTVTIRDYITVIRNFDEDTDCGPQGAPFDKRLWESGCVGTGRTRTDSVKFPKDCDNRPCSDGGEGPGYYINDDPLVDTWPNATDTSRRAYYTSCLKFTCFQVYNTDLPIGIAVDADCGETGGSFWCLSVTGPGIEPTTLCDGDEDECIGVDLESSSSSSSSESDSSSSSSSKSSSSSSSSSESDSSSSSSSKSSSSSSSSSKSSSSSSSESSSSSSSRSSSSSSSSMNSTACAFAYGPPLPATINVEINQFQDCPCTSGTGITDVEYEGYDGETIGVGDAINKIWTIDYDGSPGNECVYTTEFSPNTGDYGTWKVYDDSDGGCSHEDSSGAFNRLKITATIVSGGVEVEVEHWQDPLTWKDYIFKGTVTGGSGYLQEGVWSSGNDWGGCDCCKSTDPGDPPCAHDDCIDWYTGGDNTRVKITT